MDDSQQRMEDVMNLADTNGKLFQVGNEFFVKDKVVGFKYELKTSYDEGKLESIKFTIQTLAGQTNISTTDVKVARTLESFLVRVLN